EVVFSDVAVTAMAGKQRVEPSGAEVDRQLLAVACGVFVSNQRAVGGIDRQLQIDARYTRRKRSEDRRPAVAMEGEGVDVGESFDHAGRGVCAAGVGGERVGGGDGVA